MATPTQASLLRTTDLRVPVTGVSEAVTRTLALPDTGVSAASALRLEEARPHPRRAHP
jgi:hypothetical protein